MKNLKFIFIGEGGFGQVFGGILGGVEGIGEMIAGGIQKAQSKGLEPPETDPTQVNMIDTLKRLRLGYQTGAEASNYKNIINQGLNNSVKGITAYNGGATGSMLGELTEAQNTAMNAYNSVASTLEKDRVGVLGMEDKATDDVAQRKLDVQEQRFTQAKSDAYGNLKSGQQNLLGGATNIEEGLNPLKKVGAVSQAQGTAFAGGLIN